MDRHVLAVALVTGAVAAFVVVVLIARRTKKDLERANAARAALLEAARGELGGLAAEVFRTAFAAAHEEYARRMAETLEAVKSEIASIGSELQGDQRSGRELLWGYWRVLRDYCPGLPPPEPPGLASPSPAAVPTTKPERAASSAAAAERPAGAPREMRPLDPQPLSVEDEARVVARHAELVAEAEAGGPLRGHRALRGAPSSVHRRSRLPLRLRLVRGVAGVSRAGGARSEGGRATSGVRWSSRGRP